MFISFLNIAKLSLHSNKEKQIFLKSFLIIIEVKNTA